MSELTPTPEEMVEEITLTVDDANVIPTPVDPTLSHEGEAADAKATGDAIAGVFEGATVNGKQATGKAFVVYGSDIVMSSAAGAPTVAAAIESAAGRTAADIMYDAQNLVTIKDEIDGIKNDIDTEITQEEIDEIFEDVFGGGE